MKTTFIYGLIDPRDNQVKYIGKSNNPGQRISQHLGECEKGNCTIKLNWLRHLLSKGLKPELIILDEVEIDKWKWWESFWYQLLTSWGCKLKNNEDPEHGGGSKLLGDVQRKSISEKLKGVPKSKEHIEKCNKKRAEKTKEDWRIIGEKRTSTLNSHPEIKKRVADAISKSKKGKTQAEILKNISPEERNRKIGEGLKNSEKWKEGIKNRNSSGVNNSRYKGSIFQYSKDKSTFVKEWEGLHDLKEEYGMSNVASVCNGHLKSAYGFFWSREKLCNLSIDF